MIVARSTRVLVTALAFAAVVSGCVKGRKTQGVEEVDVPASPVDDTPVAAQRSTAALLDVRVDVGAEDLRLHIAGAPSDARLECDLDSVPLTTCHDGAQLAKPAAGDHKISVTAYVGNAVAAIGSSAPFTVLPGKPTPGTPVAPGETVITKESLTMIVDDAAFANGMAAPLSKDFKVRFRLASAPACQAAIKCRYDSRTSQYWTDCDEDGTSFIISKDLLASGLQFLGVRAECPEQQGPTLNMFFYGVPDDYKPMMLRELKDGLGRHVVNLLKGDDCPENQQKYECSANTTEPFALCANGNVIDKPAEGYRVRLSCGDVKGPELLLNP